MSAKLKKFSCGNGKTSGCNNGRYPLHHFYFSHSSTALPFRYPLMIDFTGADEWITGCYRRRPQSDIFCLEYILEGSMLFTQHDRRYQAQPGDLFMVHRHTDSTMATGPEGYCLKRALAISGANLDSILTSLKLIEIDVIHLQNRPSINTLMIEAETIIKASDEGYQTRLSALAYHILLELAGEAKAQVYPSLLVRALELMESQLTAPPSITFLTEKLGTSAPTLYRLFKKHLNDSPLEYWLKQKTSYAAKLLQDSTLPIKEIAFRTGYTNQLYFSSEFKKRTGHSPTSYRQSED